MQIQLLATLQNNFNQEKGMEKKWPIDLTYLQDNKTG